MVIKKKQKKKKKTTKKQKMTGLQVGAALKAKQFFDSSENAVVSGL